MGAPKWPPNPPAVVAPLPSRGAPRHRWMENPMSRFTGKAVVVTGAGGGIGRATAARLAAEGASLVLVDRLKDALAETSAIIERAGVPAMTVDADVPAWSDVQRYAAAAVERFGGIDAFFNIAGVLGAVRPLVDYPE